MNSISHSKKRKLQASLNETPAKKQKKDSAKSKVESTDRKGKAKDTEFQVIRSSLVVSVAPVFANHPRSGVEEMLDSMVMRYIPALEGVVLSHDKLVFLEDKAPIKADCPFLVCKIQFDATVWRPYVGMKLVGKINLCSPDHISLLVHRTFNVSIPRHHIPTDEWEFEYGAAENDPEYGAGVQDDAENKPEEEGSGRWIHKVTGEPLGGAQKGYLEFTVIGLTVANEMLSLSGSIQPDPFSPLLAPANTTRGKSTDVSDVDKRLVADELLAEASGEEDIEGESSDSDQDGFQALGKKVGLASVEAARRKAEEAKKATEKEEKKKKRKRKAEELSKVEKAGKKKKSSKS